MPLARVVLSVAAALSVATPALAGLPTPDPGLSTIPPCFVSCPDGSFESAIVVRASFGGFPVPGSIVVLNYSACAGVVICPVDPADGYLHNPTLKTLMLVTDATGTARFRIRGGGACASPGIQIFADGIGFGSRPIAGVDQTADLVVDSQDVDAVLARVGTADLTGDLDCSGSVTAADVAIVTQHLNAMCAIATPSRPTSWGRVKILYR